MTKALTKPSFGVPSADVLMEIEASDKVNNLRAAGYRFEARLAELGRQYEDKVSELRGQYLAEVAAINEE